MFIQGVDGLRPFRLTDSGRLGPHFNIAWVDGNHYQSLVPVDMPLSCSSNGGAPTEPPNKRQKTEQGTVVVFDTCSLINLAQRRRGSIQRGLSPEEVFPFASTISKSVPLSVSALVPQAVMKELDHLKHSKKPPGWRRRVMYPRGNVEDRLHRNKFEVRSSDAVMASTLIEEAIKQKPCRLFIQNIREANNHYKIIPKGSHATTNAFNDELIKRAAMAVTHGRNGQRVIFVSDDRISRILANGTDRYRDVIVSISLSQFIHLLQNPPPIHEMSIEEIRARTSNSHAN